MIDNKLLFYNVLDLSVKFHSFAFLYKQATAVSINQVADFLALSRN